MSSWRPWPGDREQVSERPHDSTLGQQNRQSKRKCKYDRENHHGSGNHPLPARQSSSGTLKSKRRERLCNGVKGLVQTVFPDCNFLMLRKRIRKFSGFNQIEKLKGMLVVSPVYLGSGAERLICLFNLPSRSVIHGPVSNRAGKFTRPRNFHMNFHRIGQKGGARVLEVFPRLSTFQLFETCKKRSLQMDRLFKLFRLYADHCGRQRNVPLGEIVNQGPDLCHLPQGCGYCQNQTGMANGDEANDLGCEPPQHAGLPACCGF